jgi:hypothetical protein
MRIFFLFPPWSPLASAGRTAGGLRRRGVLTGMGQQRS